MNELNSKPNSQPERFKFDRPFWKRVGIALLGGAILSIFGVQALSDSDEICGGVSVTVGQDKGLDDAIENQIPQEVLNEESMKWYEHESKPIGYSSKTDTQWGDRFMVPLTNCTSEELEGVTILPWNENGPEVLAPGADRPAK